MALSVQELEAVINYWRERAPARGSAAALSPEVKRLATIYALMIFDGVTTLNIDTLDQATQQLLQAARPQPGTNNPDA